MIRIVSQTEKTEPDSWDKYGELVGKSWDDLQGDKRMQLQERRTDMAPTIPVSIGSLGRMMWEFT